MTVWRVRWEPFQDEGLTQLLDEGWEPFAVTKDSRHEIQIWLRKLVELDD